MCAAHKDRQDHKVCYGQNAALRQIERTEMKILAVIALLYFSMLAAGMVFIVDIVNGW